MKLRLLLIAALLLVPFYGHAQLYVLSPVPRMQFFDANGVPLAGGFVYSYAAGTNILLGTYQDAFGTANPNPIILDAGGFATIFLANGVDYKFCLQSALNVPQYCTDQIEVNGLATSAGIISLFSGCMNGNALRSDGTCSNPATFVGTCTGTATSSATLSLFGLGQTGATTCTSVPQQGVPLPSGGTFRNLSVSCQVGGVNSSSGVFTVWAIGGVPTAITCTVGTGTSCQDNTHTAAMSAWPAGSVAVVFTTQASETLAGCIASLEK